MGDRPVHGAPYATACLIFGLADNPPVRPYVSGRLALAGIDLRVPAAVWLDAVYAIVLEAPHELLEKVHGQITIQTARMRPDRETWGMTPDQVALTNKLTGQSKQYRH